MINPFYISPRVGMIFRIITDDNFTTDNFRILLSDISRLHKTKEVLNSIVEIYELNECFYPSSSYEYIIISSRNNVLRSVALTSDSKYEYNEILDYCLSDLHKKDFRLITYKNGQHLFQIHNTPLLFGLGSEVNKANEYSITFLFETLQS